MSLKSVGTQTGLTGFFCENTCLSSEFCDSTIPITTRDSSVRTLVCAVSSVIVSAIPITTLVRWKYILRWPNKECQEACFFQKPQGLDKEVVELNKRKANQVTLGLKLPSFHGQNIQFCHRLWFTGSHTACSWAVQRHTGHNGYFCVDTCLNKVFCD